MKNKNRIAALFPGQGAQYVGMGKSFCSFQTAKRTFEEADDLLQEKISQIIFEGPEDQLTHTKNSQLAIFIHSAAILRVLNEKFNFSFSFTAGLSLGEYTALYASKRLSFKQTLLLIQKRAYLMHEACLLQKGTMAAVLGLSSEIIEEKIQGIEGLWIANYNTPGQIVISGQKDAVEKGIAVLKQANAKRVIPLQVHGAFHSGLMEDAQKALIPFLDPCDLQPSDIQMVPNLTGISTSDEDLILKGLKGQMTGSVRWEKSIRAMMDQNVDLFLEIGCGKSLTAMNRKMGAKPTLSIEHPEDLALLDQIAKN